MSDYLFDKQGDPDPEIARLEKLLAPLANRGSMPPLPARTPKRSRRRFIVAAASVAMAAAIAALLVAKPWRPAPTWLDSGGATMHLAIGDIGSVDLAPHTRARLVGGGPAPHTLELRSGRLHATIDAPPRQFAVVTPHVVVTDLGCAFDVIVDEAGRGQVVVQTGRVGVASRGAAETIVSAGERVELTERGIGELQPSAAMTPPPLPSPPLPSPLPNVASPASPSVPPGPVRSPPGAVRSPPRQPTGSTHTPSHRNAPGTPPVRPAAAAPVRPLAPNKPAPASGIRHDPLKDLEHSVE